MIVGIIEIVCAGFSLIDIFRTGFSISPIVSVVITAAVAGMLIYGVKKERRCFIIPNMILLVNFFSVFMLFQFLSQP